MLTKISVEAALNAELDDHLGYDKHKSLITPTVAMAIAVKRYKQKQVNLNSTHRGIEMAPSNLNGSKRISVVLL